MDENGKINRPFAKDENSAWLYELIARLQELLDSMKKSEGKDAFTPPLDANTFHVSQVGKSLIKQLKTITSQEGSEDIVNSGFKELDQMMYGGFRKGEFIILGGRPGMGKTTLMLNIVHHVVHQCKKPVFLISTENSGTNLLQRVVAMMNGIKPFEGMQAKPTEEVWDLYMDTIKHIEEMPLYIDDTQPNDIQRIKDISRWMKVKHGIQLLCIESIQSIKSGRHFRNRDQEVGYICQQLRDLAREIDIPVFVISHLNRYAEYRGISKRPGLSDLRDSGSIEQVADKVLLLYRPEYYKIEFDYEDNPVHRLAEVILAKNRNGKTGVVKLERNEDFTWFTDFKDYITDIKIRPSRMNDFDDEDLPF